jgi:hypothetical protein
MHYTVLARLLWAITCLHHASPWLWLSIAVEPLSPHLSTLAASHPHDLALALAGMHTQLVRRETVDAFISESSTATQTFTPRKAGGKYKKGSLNAAPGSFYCDSHLAALHPQAALVGSVARQAAAAWVECTGVSTRKHQTLQGVPGRALEASVRAVAAMNTSPADPLCPLVLNHLGGHKPGETESKQVREQVVWPTSASWQKGVLLASALAGSALKPDNLWVQLVSQQLMATYLSNHQQQHPQQLVQFEGSVAALLAIQMRVQDKKGLEAISNFMRTGVHTFAASFVVPLDQQQQEQQQQQVPDFEQSLRMATLIRAATNLGNHIPSAYIQHFLSTTIKQVGQDLFGYERWPMPFSFLHIRM